MPRDRSPPRRALDGGILMTMQRLSQGGADRVAVLLANGFAEAGIPTAIALLRGEGEGEATLRELLRPDIALSVAGPPLGRRRDIARGVPFIVGEIAVLRPSVVLASSNNMGLVTALAALSSRQRGVRFAMKVTNPVLRPKDKGAITTRYRRALYDFLFARYDCVLALSAAERDTLAGLYPHHAARLSVAANAYIRPDMFEDVYEQPPHGAGRIVTLARMMPQKRLDTLLDAFARVTFPGSRLTIVGDGPERAQLTRQAAALGIADRVEMPGFEEDVLPWLRGANLFALSSDYEGLPAAPIEALACNVPVVTTDCFAAAHDLLDGADNCAVVPKRDPQALAAAIDWSLSSPNPPTGLRERARGYAIERAISEHIAALTPLLDR